MISVDDHVVEPADMFEGRVPAHLADRAPRIVETPAGPPGVGVRGRAVHPGRHERGRRPTPGDGQARAVPLRADAARLLRHRRPRPRHGHQRRLGVGELPVDDHRILRTGVLQRLDRDARRGVHPARGTTGCSRSGTRQFPERIIPLGITYLADPELAAAEIRRNASAGFTGVSMPERPHMIGLPSLWDREHWDPIIQRVRRDRHRRVVARRQRGRRARTARRPQPPARRDAVRSAVAARVRGVAVVGVPARPPHVEDRDERRRHRLGADAARPARQHHRPVRLRARLGRPPGRRAQAQLLVLHPRRPVDDRHPPPHRRREHHGRDRLPARRRHVARHPARHREVLGPHPEPRAARDVQRERRRALPPPAPRTSCSHDDVRAHTREARARISRCARRS